MHCPLKFCDGACLKRSTKSRREKQEISYYVEETTDISLKKVLAVVIWYFIERASSIKTALLSLYEVIEATAEALFQILETALFEYDFNFETALA